MAIVELVVRRVYGVLEILAFHPRRKRKKYSLLLVAVNLDLFT